MQTTLLFYLALLVYLVPESRQALIECPLLHGIIQKETDTQKIIHYDFMRFGYSKSNKQPSLDMFSQKTNSEFFIYFFQKNQQTRQYLAHSIQQQISCNFQLIKLFYKTITNKDKNLFICQTNLENLESSLSKLVAGSSEQDIVVLTG